VTPERLPTETERAYHAFVTFCEVGGKASHVARKLSCCRQNVTRWQKRHRWRERFNALRLRETEQRIQAEERAVEQVATWTEATRAEAANRALTVADELNDAAQWFVKRSRNLALSLAERKLASENAARFFVAARDVLLSGIGGAATNYAVAPVNIQVISKYVDEHGNPAEEPPMPETLEEIEALANQLHESQQRLPCSDWSETGADATPSPPDDQQTEPAPVVVERAPNPDLVEDKRAHIPSRLSTIPTSDGRGAR
jgi:hypothetical protein